jgi:hypothetical protein
MRSIFIGVSSGRILKTGIYKYLFLLINSYKSCAVNRHTLTLRADACNAPALHCANDRRRLPWRCAGAVCAQFAHCKSGSYNNKGKRQHKGGPVRNGEETA